MAASYVRVSLVCTTASVLAFEFHDITPSCAYVSLAYSTIRSRFVSKRHRHRHREKRTNTRTNAPRAALSLRPAQDCVNERRHAGAIGAMMMN